TGYDHSLSLKSDGTVVAWGTDEQGQSTVPTGLINVTAIAAGGEQSLALRSDGTVVAWGKFSDPCVPAFYPELVPPGLGNVTAISAGAGHSLALKSDGMVTAWGYNWFGETNVPAGLSN